MIGIFLADIHLSLKPPIWRSVEPDWFEAMRRPLDEVSVLSQHFDCPVFCAGDVFDRWNSSPELINWAGEVMPQMYAIPGQHDLPLHRYEDIKKSAYYSLVKMDKIQNILPGSLVNKNNMAIRGFPYSCEIKHAKGDTGLEIALIHDYIWMKGYSYPNVSQESKLKTGHWKGYDVQVYGDNHKGFLKSTKPVQFFNCGTLMRRKSDEIDYRPQVGLLDENGIMHTYLLDISKDKHLELPEAHEPGEFDMKAFIQGLEELGDTALDFTEAIKQYMKTKKISTEVKTIILEALGM